MTANTMAAAKTGSMRNVPKRTAVKWVGLTILAAATAAVVPHLIPLARPVAEAPLSIGSAVGMSGAPPPTTSGLTQRIAEMESRLRTAPDDTGAAVLLADALLRQARATNDGRPAGRASEVLNAALKNHPAHYELLRMLGAIYLSQHRFREALDVGRRARDLRPEDAWNYGVMGDAQIELGDYEQAFEAFEKMMTLRPNAAAYARVAYARELRGDVPGALAAMQMAAKATAPNDPEAQAWYAVQAGELYLKMHRFDDADREYRRAIFVFPNYPLAVVGRGKLQVARGDRDSALLTFLDQLKRTPTLDLAARIGDLYAERGDTAQSDHYYQLAEDLAGPGVAQTEANLALFLADHGRKLSEAVAIAETVAAARHDIFTEDALAWAYYKAGRFHEAYAASQRALRTGTRDDAVLSRAARISAAVQHQRLAG
jgi:tetratricopeptide (TPR) repeat protein